MQVSFPDARLNQPSTRVKLRVFTLDSVPMQRAFREVCSEEGFDEYLQATLDRISAIESLGRTRELTIKDLWNKGQYRISIADSKGCPEKSVVFDVLPKDDSEDA